MDEWEFRSTYIGQGELLAGPLALSIHAARLAGRSATWYVDNVSAASALIKGASPVADSSPMALVASLLAAAAGCRLWFEYVASAQNPSDVLSRDGYEDKAVKRALAEGSWQAYQPSIDWAALFRLDSAAALLQRWGPEERPAAAALG